MLLGRRSLVFYRPTVRLRLDNFSPPGWRTLKFIRPMSCGVRWKNYLTSVRLLFRRQRISPIGSPSAVFVGKPPPPTSFASFLFGEDWLYSRAQFLAIFVGNPPRSGPPVPESREGFFLPWSLTLLWSVPCFQAKILVVGQVHPRVGT